MVKVLVNGGLFEISFQWNKYKIGADCQGQ